MKKIIATILAVITAIGLFAFSACSMGNNGINDGTSDNNGTVKTEVKGKIDGNYSEVDSEHYDDILERFDGAIPAAEDAETAGGNARAEAKIKLTIGDKSLTLNTSSALDLILDVTKIDQDGLDVIKGAAIKNSTNLKADDGLSSEAWGIIGPIMFGNEYPELADALEQEDMEMIAKIITSIDGANASAAFNGYVKDSKIYTDALVTGIPEGIQEIVTGNFGIDFTALAEGIKYSFTQEELMSLIGNLIGSMLGLNGNMENSNYSAQAFDSDNPFALDLDDVDLDYLCELLKLKVYSETKNGAITVKVATTADTKLAVETLLKAKLNDDLAEIVENLTVSKLDMEIYLSLDENNVLTAVAVNVNAKMSANVYEKEVNLDLNGALDCSFAVPESIEYPSFEGYLSPSAEENAAA